MIDWITVAAGIATVLGFALSVLQTLRYLDARNDLAQLKRSRNANIWLNIAMTLNAYESIEDARNLVGDDDNPRQKELLMSKINSVRRCMVDQYLQLLKEAVLDEEEFTESTIAHWQNIGRLENDWRTAQARKYIRTSVNIRANSTQTNEQKPADCYQKSR
jgi:hypothetical protein